MKNEKICLCKEKKSVTIELMKQLVYNACSDMFESLKNGGKDMSENSEKDNSRKADFKIGDLVIYGSNGVCRIKACGTLDSSAVRKDTLYYTVEPYYASGTTYYVPVDSQQVLLRRVVSRQEALELIDEIVDMEELWIEDERRRELEYRAAVKKGDCRELVKMIKTIYLRKQSRIAQGKKVPAGDERYFKLAEEYLYGELAVSLDMTKEETKDFVIQRVSQMTEK